MFWGYRHFNFRVIELSGPKTIALTPFSFRLDTWSFIKEIKGKITRQSVSTTSLAPCSKKSNTNSLMWNVKLSSDPVSDPKTNVSFDYYVDSLRFL